MASLRSKIFQAKWSLKLPPKKERNNFSIELYNGSQGLFILPVWLSYRHEFCCVFIWKDVHPACRDLGCKIRDLGNRGGPPSSYEHNRILNKENLSSASSR